MDGGTFTISNGGVFGSLMGTPIINPPQSAILGMHGIFDRPVAINGKVRVHWKAFDICNLPMSCSAKCLRLTEICVPCFGTLLFSRGFHREEKWRKWYLDSV